MSTLTYPTLSGGALYVDAAAESLCFRKVLTYLALTEPCVICAIFTTSTHAHCLYITQQMSV